MKTIAKITIFILVLIGLVCLGSAAPTTVTTQMSPFKQMLLKQGDIHDKLEMVLDRMGLVIDAAATQSPHSTSKIFGVNLGLFLLILFVVCLFFAGCFLFCVLLVWWMNSGQNGKSMNTTTTTAAATNMALDGEL